MDKAGTHREPALCWVLKCGGNYEFRLVGTSYLITETHFGSIGLERGVKVGGGALGEGLL